jgi:dihydrofolate synthase / folylpolyglutamate synthase
VNAPEALAWLDAHINLESIGVPPGVSRRASAPTLERMEALATLLGSPQLEYPVVHLTGTNGKTSTARMVTALLVEAGLSVGASTSPHLERVNERITWNGAPVDDVTLAELLTVIRDIEPHLPAPPSYFEILTGAALRYFADVAVDAAVLEVGLGGRWDATNVADARVAVATNVSIDHVEYLGHERSDIAREKAGIIKPNSSLVLGEVDPELVPIFLDRAPPRVVMRHRDFGVSDRSLAHGGQVLDLYTPEARYEQVFLSLHGAHQSDNASAALTAAECLLERPVHDELVRDVLGAVRSPGRLEVVGHRPLVLLDGAHNVAGAQALVAALAEEFPASRRTLVVGVLREKDPLEMLGALGAASAARVVCCRPPSPRARDPEDLATAARELGVPDERVDVVEEVAGAIEHALDVTDPDEQIVVTGSLYVVGAARSVLMGRSGGTPTGRVPPT